MEIVTEMQVVVASGEMHDLPHDQAFVYWIPSILVAIAMVIILLCSFWKFHRRKRLIRELQLEYMELNLSAKRPRIGAIRCNTHGASWDDLMASLCSSGFQNLPTIPTGNKSPRVGTLYDVKEETQSQVSDRDNQSISDKPLNIYYEKRGYIETDRKPKKEKKKKKKRSKHNIHSGTFHSNEAFDNDDIAKIPSPRKLPVIENALWSGYSDRHTTDLQSPSFYFSGSFIPNNDNPSDIPLHPRTETRHSHKGTRRSNKPQEEKVFWLLATDIKQSPV